MSIVWKGDTIAAWSGKEAAAADRIVEGTFTKGGKVVPVFQFKVKPTDLVQNGVRAELLRDAHWPEGTERFFAFSVFFPQSYPTLANAWQVFHQYHQGYKNGMTVGQSPPVEFALNGDKIQLNTNHYVSPYPVTTHWSMPLVRETWLDFVFHVKLSSNPAVGFIELYLNAQLVMPKKNVATMFPNYDVYMKSGIYRARTIQPEATLYQTGFVEATQLQEIYVPVAPPPVVPPHPLWTIGDAAMILKDGKMKALALDKATAQEIIDVMNE